MSRDPLWKRDAKGVEHPALEILLAFIREQCIEHEQNRIQEHLLAGCDPCNRLHTDLKQSSHTLDNLNHRSRYLYYPELQTNRVLRHMQRGEPLTSAWTGKRKRKFQVRSQPASSQQASRTGLRVFRLSFPVAFGLLLICMTVAVVLAYTIASFVSSSSSSPDQPHSRVYNSPQITPIIAEHQPTPTITPSASATLQTSPTLTPVVKGLRIEWCPRHDYWDTLFAICGRGFKAGDKVSLMLEYAGSQNPVIEGLYRVNKYGEFTAYLFLYPCANPPVAIYARDDTLMPATVVSNTLTNIPVVGCHERTPTITPAGG